MTHQETSLKAAQVEYDDQLPAGWADAGETLVKCHVTGNAVPVQDTVTTKDGVTLEKAQWDRVKSLVQKALGILYEADTAVSGEYMPEPAALLEARDAVNELIRISE